MGGSIFTRTHGTNERSNKLAVAPLLDVSSSGADDGFLHSFFFKKKKQKSTKTKKKISFCVWCLFEYKTVKYVCCVCSKPKIPKKKIHFGLMMTRLKPIIQVHSKSVNDFKRSSCTLDVLVM